MNKTTARSSVFPGDAPFPLSGARAHEVCGPGASGFAAISCATHEGPVVWICEGRGRARLHPHGLARFCDPSRFVFAYGKTHKDVLWMAEEALRSGAAGVVVAEISQAIDLNAGRRLQLAAQAGQSRGLFLIPEGAGSNAAQTRWRCAPVYNTQGGDWTLFEWCCTKNKAGTTADWTVHWNETTRRIDMVLRSGERQLSAAHNL